MTIASCGSVNALTMSLPATTAIPAQKATLPKGLFVAKIPVSSKIKQRLTHDISSITMLSLMRPANTGLQNGKRIPEILVIGLRLSAESSQIPREIIELIAMQRKSGIIFVCVRDARDVEGNIIDGMEECAFAVRRALPCRPGHTPTYTIFTSAWKPASEATLRFPDLDAVGEADDGAAGIACDAEGDISNQSAIASIDDLWESFCSQIIFGVDYADPANLDARITRSMQISKLEEEIARLTANHQRAKSTEQRNEIFAKLHKAKQQLEALKE